jgi:hypothetical protein
MMMQHIYSERAGEGATLTPASFVGLSRTSASSIRVRTDQLSHSPQITQPQSRQDALCTGATAECLRLLHHRRLHRRGRDCAQQLRLPPDSHRRHPAAQRAGSQGAAALLQLQEGGVRTRQVRLRHWYVANRLNTQTRQCSCPAGHHTNRAQI